MLGNVSVEYTQRNATLSKLIQPNDQLVTTTLAVRTDGNDNIEYRQRHIDKIIELMQNCNIDGEKKKEKGKRNKKKDKTGDSV